MEEQRYALLIDSDNISAKYVKNIIDELTKYGIITIKRIYGDFTKPGLSPWKEILLKHSIQPMQQFAYTRGKNATDSFMIIDAMDILYSNNVDGFCIVTSDSDFTRLAQRIRESGKMVVGMGEKKTPGAFIAACDKFTYLGNISDEEDLTDEESAVDDAAKTHKDQVKIEKAIMDIITENEGNGKKETNISEIGNRLVKMYPDFDVRNYGYSKLSRFCQDLPNIQLVNENSACVLAMEGKEADIDSRIKELVAKAGNGGIELGSLGRKLKQAVPDFDVKRYGFSQFNKYIKSLGYLRIKQDKKKNRIIVTLK